MAETSKKTLLVLLILIILSSIIGTWVFVTGVDAKQKIVVTTPKTATGSGELSLEIKGPASSTTNAQIGFEITQPSGKRS